MLSSKHFIKETFKVPHCFILLLHITSSVAAAYLPSRAVFAHNYDSIVYWVN